MTSITRGVFPPLPTPMGPDGNVVYEQLAAVIRHVESGGVDGIVPCGTTGERSTLRPDEHRRVIEFTVEEASTPVIAGTGSSSTWETVELTRYAEAVGADGALVIGPYYTGPNEDDLVTHYREVADAVDIPLLVYNFPGGMSFNIPPSVVERLASQPNIVGIKDSSGDVGQMEELCRRTRDSDFDVLSGWDSLLLPAVSVGAVGLVGICANVFPADSVDLLVAAKKGYTEQAIELHDQFASLEEALLVEKPQITVKQALALRGVCEPGVRRPHTQMDDDQVETLRNAVESF